MLEDAKNSLPADISERLSLNRFFAFQRDIVNDELTDLVPDLVEDALENPTGTYQMVTKFQNEKLMDIDRSTIEIKQMLTDMMDMLQKVSKNNGAGGDGILDDLLGLLGLRGLLGGGRNKGKNNKPDGKDDKKSKNNDKKTKKKSGFLSNIFKKGIGRGPVAALIGAGAGSALLYDAFNDDVDFKEFANNVIDGKYNEDLTNMAIPAGIVGAGALAGSYFGDVPEAKQVSKPPPKKIALPRRSDLPPTHPEYRAKGTPGAGQFVSQKQMQSAMPAPQSAPAKSGGFFSKAASYVTAPFKAVGNLAKGSSAAIIGMSLIYFYQDVSSLPKDLTEEEYRKEVTRLALETIAVTGLTVFASFATAMIAGSIGAAAGGVPALPFSVMGAIAGFIAGEFAVDYYGDTAKDAVNDPEFKAIVDKIVEWVIKGVSASKGAYETVTDSMGGGIFSSLMMSNPVGMATGLASSAIMNAFKTDDTSVTNNKVTPTQMITGNQGRGNMQATLEANKKQPQMITGDQGRGNMQATLEANQSIFDKFTPAAIMGNMAASLGAGNKMQSLAGITGALQGLDASKLDVANMNLLGGVGGVAGLMSLAGMKSISPAQAEELGIAPDKLKEMNASLQTAPQAATIAAAMAPQADRVISQNPVDVNKNFQDAMTQKIAGISQQIMDASKIPVPSSPSLAINSFPSFRSAPLPTSLAVSALRGNGLADVYAHPFSGPTMERMDRGGETHFG